MKDKSHVTFLGKQQSVMYGKIFLKMTKKAAKTLCSQWDTP